MKFALVSGRSRRRERAWRVSWWMTNGRRQDRRHRLCGSGMDGPRGTTRRRSELTARISLYEQERSPLRAKWRSRKRVRRMTLWNTGAASWSERIRHGRRQPRIRGNPREIVRRTESEGSEPANWNPIWKSCRGLRERRHAHRLPRRHRIRPCCRPVSICQ